MTVKRILILALAAVMVTTAADAKRRHGSRHKRNLVTKAVIVYVLTEDDCPRNPPVPTICYWRRAK